LIGIVYIFIFIFINSEFFYYPRSRKTNEELLEEEAEELMKKVEISATKRKRRTRIEIVIKEPGMEFYNVLYLLVDLSSNFTNICLLFYLLNEIERNLIVMIFYTFLLAIFMLRVLFVITEMKNDYEYLFGYLISFFQGIRLLTVTGQYNLLYTAGCLFMFLLVMQYCLTERRKFLVTSILMFHLFSACLYITSLFLFVMMVLVFCLPMILRNDKKMHCSTLIMFLPIIVIAIFQIFGLKTIFMKFYEFEDYLKEGLGFDMFSFVQKIVHGYKSYEFTIISSVFDFTNRIFN
jgi:hypothetical protein